MLDCAMVRPRSDSTAARHRASTEPASYRPDRGRSDYIWDRAAAPPLRAGGISSVQVVGAAKLDVRCKRSAIEHIQGCLYICCEQYDCDTESCSGYADVKESATSVDDAVGAVRQVPPVRV